MRLVLCALGIWLGSQPAFAQADTQPTQPGPRRNAWGLGFDARQLHITPSDRRYSQRTVAPDINVGYVHIGDRWFAMGRGHLAFGPQSEKFEGSPPIDFEGYGFSATYGYSLTSDLRSKGGDYGVEMGLEVFELVGRSFRQQKLEDGSTTDAWVMKERWTALTPALFATFLETARPRGNKPELLVTRLEGFRVSLGAVIPVQKSWNLRWERNNVPNEADGSWQGVFAVLSVSAWLGI